MDSGLTEGCQALLQAISKSATAVDGFLDGFPSGRERLAPVSRELVALRDAVSEFAARSGGFDVHPVPDQLWDSIKALPAGCEELLDRLDRAVARPASHDRAPGEWLQGMPGAVAAFAGPLESCRKALKLALEALDLYESSLPTPALHP